MIVVLKTNRYLYNAVSLGDLSWLLLKFLHDLSAKNLQGHFHRQSYHIYRVPGYCKAHWHRFGCGCNPHLPYGLSLIYLDKNFRQSCLRNSSSESITEVP